MIELLRKLTEAWGPSGYEHQIREMILEEVKPYADEITVDPLGNLICQVGQGEKKIMVAAHMDEIGLMATYREPVSGYMRFTNIGATMHNTLHSSRVRFEDGTIGVVAVENARGTGRRSLPDLVGFYIDVGEHIPEGSPAAFWRELQTTGNHIIAKSLDDRIGCTILIETVKRLNKQSANQVFFTFTVQEEVGRRGVVPSAYSINPDIGLAVDVTSSGDEIKGRKAPTKLGAGPAIKIFDSAHVVPPSVRDWMIATAEKNEIPFQREILVGGSTDASYLQLARAGVPSGAISIPCRFVHSPSEIVDVNDVNASIDLLTALLSNPASL